MFKIIPINVAEGIFLPLFDANLSRLDTFSIEEHGLEEHYKRGGFKQAWDSMLITTHAPRLKLVWKGEVNLGEYDTLRFFLKFASQIRLRATAVVNGLEVLLFEEVYGDVTPIEPTSGTLPLEAVITQITFEFENQGQPGSELVINYSWAGAVNSTKEYLIEEELPKYDSIWNGLINPEGRAGIRNNILFSESELKEFKLRIKEPYFEPMAQMLMHRAREIEDFAPETEIREYAAVGVHMHRFVRIRDRGRTILDHYIIPLAVAGYLFDNDKWSKLAARMILSLAHTPKWFEGPQACLEGSYWHHICFMEDHISSTIAVALGFLGDLLTEEAIAVVMRSINTAWQVVDSKCREKGYRRFMNQGVVGNCGRMLGAYSLYKNGYGSAEIMDTIYQEHTAIINNYINAEGHCPEGPHYYIYSFASSISLWIAYARYKKLPIGDVVPKRFKDSISYVEAMITTDPRGVSVPVNCSGTGALFSGLLIAFYIGVCQWDKGYNYLKERMKDISSSAKQSSPGLETLLLLKFIPKDIPEIEEKENDDIKIFLKGGLAVYKFTGAMKGKLWALAERNPMTCHFHEDRGSFILELEGKMMLLDPGMTNYSNPISWLMEKKEYHNVAYPKGLDMKIITSATQRVLDNSARPPETSLIIEDLRSTEPKLEAVEKLQDGISLDMNVTELYGEEVLAGMRKCKFVNNTNCCELKLRDIWKFKNQRGIEINYLSYYPWKIDGNTVESVVEGIRMTLEVQELHDLICHLSVDELMKDSNLRQIYRLNIKTAAGTEVDVVSKFRFINQSAKLYI
jgi:hypothetical protein